MNSILTLAGLLLAARPAPERYSDKVIYRDKVRINLEYIRNRRFRDDLEDGLWVMLQEAIKSKRSSCVQQALWNASNAHASCPGTDDATPNFR